jgi:hypothetical protein
VGLQILYERCAGIDIGKDIIAVPVRTPGDGPDGRNTVKRTFKTFYGVLRECARWLTGLGVTHVAMEATGIYSPEVTKKRPRVDISARPCASGLRRYEHFVTWVALLMHQMNQRLLCRLSASNSPSWPKCPVVLRFGA